MEEESDVDDPAIRIDVPGAARTFNPISVRDRSHTG
jgi:hypothetical protein